MRLKSGIDEGLLIIVPLGLITVLLVGLALASCGGWCNSVDCTPATKLACLWLIVPVSIAIFMICHPEW